MKSIFAFLILSILYSCDYPKYYFDAPVLCEGKIQMHYDREKYFIGEVNRILSKSQPSDFRYYFKTFLIEDGNDYMLVNFRNDDVCMDVKMRVEKLGKLEGMKRTNGTSYPNELHELEWTTRLNTGLLEVYYKDIHDIID